jgi:hypothetical protein
LDHFEQLISTRIIRAMGFRNTDYVKNLQSEWYTALAQEAFVSEL